MTLFTSFFLSGRMEKNRTLSSGNASSQSRPICKAPLEDDRVVQYSDIWILDIAVPWRNPLSDAARCAMAIHTLLSTVVMVCTCIFGRCMLVTNRTMFREICYSEWTTSCSCAYLRWVCTASATGFTKLWIWAWKSVQAERICATEGNACNCLCSNILLYACMLLSVYQAVFNLTYVQFTIQIMQLKLTKFQIFLIWLPPFATCYMENTIAYVIKCRRWCGALKKIVSELRCYFSNVPVATWLLNATRRKYTCC